MTQCRPSCNGSRHRRQRRHQSSWPAANTAQSSLADGEHGAVFTGRRRIWRRRMRRFTCAAPASTAAGPVSYSSGVHIYQSHRSSSRVNRCDFGPSLAEVSAGRRLRRAGGGRRWAVAGRGGGSRLARAGRGAVTVTDTRHRQQSITPAIWHMTLTGERCLARLYGRRCHRWAGRGRIDVPGERP